MNTWILLPVLLPAVAGVALLAPPSGSIWLWEGLGKQTES